MARHRSPSGARPVPGHGAPPSAPAVQGTHRLPAPPTASLRGRATVAAVAAGAVVAAGQSLVPALGTAGSAGSDWVAVSASLPADGRTSTEAAGGTEAIGGDQLPVDSLAVDRLDPASEVDVKSLTKAMNIGQQLAQKASILDAALADGAPGAFLFGGSAFVTPVAGQFTSGFGARWGTAHQGIDIANRIGTPIFAVTDAVVEESGPEPGFGMWVVLRHTDGTQTVYGHINRSFVRAGERVRAGEQIAEVGNRGRSTGPHLHFEVWDADGTKLNPATWLRKHGIRF